jgi:alkanesulfonate monooxygenase SsuD/methylene tetrahydromethanopterin reductase-like flavin-dependent oxidoreductase (luciferase family)
MDETAAGGQAIHPWVAAGLRGVRAGVLIAGPQPDWTQYHAVATLAEDLGFDSMWVADHPLILGDCWTRLAALAVTTERIRLGSLVSCVYYRNPVLLAQMAADVDRWSGGRLVLGLGIGDQAGEFAQMGLPFPSTRERQAALEETIQVVRGVSGSTPFTYRGTYARAEQSQIPFAPAQQPSIPLLIAGGGERVTLRQVAQYADACNFGPHVHSGSASTVTDVARKYDALRAHCQAFDRPVDAILRTHLTLPLVLGETASAIAAKQQTVSPRLREMVRSGIFEGTPSEAIAHYGALIRAGVQYCVISIWYNDLETLRVFGEQVLPALEALPVE